MRKPRPFAEKAKQSLTEPEVGRDAAIAAIEKLGRSVQYDERSPERPILKVELNRTQVTDAGLEHLKGLTSLQTLKLGGSQVTDADVNELKKALPKCDIFR